MQRLARMSIGLTLMASSALGQSRNPSMVHDINQQAVVRSSDPGPIRASGPGISVSSPFSFTRLGPFSLFAASSASGVDLWRTVGTAASTTKVPDINPDGHSFPQAALVLATRVYMSARSPATGDELFAYDSFTNKVWLVRDISPGVRSSGPRQLASVGRGKFVFRASTSAEGYELWGSDGTSAGTMLLRDIHPGPGSSHLSALATSPNGRSVYLQAHNGSHGSELWVTDGTSVGTMLLKDINPGPAGSEPLYFHNLGNKTLFQANRARPSTPTLHVTDGTTSGTFEVKGVALDLSHRAELGGRLIFLGSDRAHGREPWITDGTTAGTVLLKDCNPGPGDGLFRFPHVFNGKCYFAASPAGSSSNAELWVTDGTAAGTVLVKDIYPGPAGSDPSFLNDNGVEVLFQARTQQHGRELHKTDGTAAGTMLVKDIRKGPQDSRARFMTRGLGRTVLFAANDGVHGNELWASDGTTGGTVLVKDIHGKGHTADSAPNYMARLGRWTLFGASDGKSPYGLWRTDGTAAGTSVVSSGSFTGGPFYICAVGSKVVFSAYHSSRGAELWESDGRRTKLLQDIHPGAGSSFPSGMTNVDGVVYFAAADGVHASELWRTDGTAAGTYMVKDIAPGRHPSLPTGFEELPGSGGRFVFSARNSNGTELWTSDGSSAGTQLVKDIVKGLLSSWPRDFEPFGNAVLFNARDGNGAELWRTDGTEAGTVLVKDINPGGASSSPRCIADAQSLAFFSATSGATGDRELWCTDGTPPGTRLVKDIFPGEQGSFPTYITPAGRGRVLFTATDVSIDRELWWSDGTSQGTRRVANLNLAGNSEPKMLTNGVGPRFHQHRNRFYFSADGGSKGREPWVWDAGALAWRVGFGCASSGPLPRLWATDPELGRTQRIVTEGMVNNVAAVTVLGVPDETPSRIGDCRIRFDLALPWLILDAWVGPRRTFNLPIPNVADLGGVHIAIQSVAIGANAPTDRWSNGVFAVLDR